MRITENTVTDYLISLRSSLEGLPHLERDEIVSEINAHIRDSLEQGLSIEQILSKLGGAKELGAQYRGIRWAEAVSQARSPWSMLRSVFGLARTSTIGAGCFLLALIGYVSGAALVVTALLKPFFPEQMGLWVGPGVFNFGFHEPGRFGGGVGIVLLTGSPAHEVLGRWYIPVTCVLGAFLIWGTTNLLRRLAKRIKHDNTQSTLQLQFPSRVQRASD